jgi:ABC-type Fe3+-hydroxamate transport system substrate-binding protein
MVGLVVSVLLLLLGACKPPESRHASGSADRPVTIVDDGGDTITLSHPARRIV